MKIINIFCAFLGFMVGYCFDMVFFDSLGVGQRFFIMSVISIVIYLAIVVALHRKGLVKIRIGRNS